MTAGSSFMSRPRLVGIALLMATFVAGMFSGAALERRAGARAPQPEPQAKAQPAERVHGGGRGHTHRTILDQIDLTPEQRARIDSILQIGRQRMDAFWKETGPGYRALVDSTRAQVRAIMNPEQRARYDELRAAARRARTGNSEAADDSLSGPKTGTDGRAESGDHLERQGASKESGTR